MTGAAMRTRLRRQWLPLAAALGLLVCTLIPLAALPDHPLCPWRAISGLPCPGCGLTRGLVSAAHGRFGQAWGFHPLAPALYAGLWFVLGLPLLHRRPRLWAALTRCRRPAAALVPAIVLLLWVWNLLRIILRPGAGG